MICPNCKKEAKEYPGAITICDDCGALKRNSDGTAEPCDCPPEPTPSKACQTAEEKTQEPDSRPALAPAGRLARGLNLHIDFEDD